MNNTYRIVNAQTGEDPLDLPPGYLNHETLQSAVHTLRNAGALGCWARHLNVIHGPCKLILARRLNGVVNVWDQGRWWNV